MDVPPTTPPSAPDAATTAKYVPPKRFYHGQPTYVYVYWGIAGFALALYGVQAFRDYRRDKRDLQSAQERWAAGDEAPPRTKWD